VNTLKNIREEEEEEKEEEEEYSQEYYYKFDNPLVKEYGYVKITNTLLTLQFPIKPDQTKIYTPMQHVQLHLNNHLIFHSNWLPILSTQDLFKIKSMIYQIWQEYMILTHYKYHPSSWHSFFTPLFTIFNDYHYNLTCSVKNNTTYIQLITKNSNLHSPSRLSPPPVHIKIYLGSYLLLCSKTQLQNLDTDSVEFVLSFILNKLIN
jgi:hypothetical protein